MRIGLNLLYCREQMGGVWNYVKNLLSALGDAGGTNEYFVFVTTDSLPLVPKRESFRTVSVPISAHSATQRIFYEQFLLPLQARALGLECMHWFAATSSVIDGMPAALSVYDLQFIENERTFGAVKRWYLSNLVPHSARRARLVLPMSNTTASKLVEHYGVPMEKILVVPAPIPREFRVHGFEAIGRFRRAYALPDKFWLYVAHCYPHKNHDRLIRAFEAFSKRSGVTWPLVLRGDGMTQGLKIPAGANIRVLPRLEDAEMALLYSSASAMMFPSLYEGCGIPLLEAMACGCPIAASEIPAVTEFVGPAAIKFDPRNVDSISRAFDQVYKNGVDVEECRLLGFERVSRLNPARIGASLAQAYECIADGSKNYSRKLNLSKSFNQPIYKG